MFSKIALLQLVTLQINLLVGIRGVGLER